MNPYQQLKSVIRKYQGYRIKSIDELESVIKEIRELKIHFQFMDFYRGQSLTKYKLNSGLSRFGKSINELEKIEKNLFCNFNLFVKSIKNYVRTPFTKNVENYQLKNKWYSLFQAQHLGLKTRLMDWSINSTIALNFAVENNKYHGKDGTIHVFLVPHDLCVNDREIKTITESIDPFDIEQDMMINTPIYMLDNKLDYIGERRMSRQSGRFWMQSIEKSIIPLDEQNDYNSMLIELIIDGDSKAKIKEELIASQSEVDWHYYRRDSNIDFTINLINVIHLHNKFLIQKTINYTILALTFIYRKFK